jgi:hypothetical protein
MARSKNRRRSNRRKANNNMQWIIGGLAGGAVLIIAALVLGVFQGDDSASPQPFDPNFEPEVTGAPSVAVDQEVIDYGDVKLGTTVTTVFNVRNVGDEPLQILGEPRVELVEGC